MASAIQWQMSQLWIGPTYAGGNYYYVVYPGPDATKPSFQALRALPPDSSGLPVPGSAITLGTYGTLTAAQAACQNDLNPPIPAGLHTQVGV